MLKKSLLVLLVFCIGIGAILWWYLAQFSEQPATYLATDKTQRFIDSGDVVGTLDQGTHAWLGLPFAAPPLGDLRWRAPRPVQAWNTQLQATAFGAKCAQANFSGEFSGSEDCLYLNVWAPPAVAAKLPVMLFVHGGGNHIGDASTPIYNGANLARTHNLIVVTVHYRLGPLGWLAHPSLRSNGTSLTERADNSGNYATLDIVQAMQWVQRNIAAFGGDPGNVTLFGESAGAFNILSLMVSPLAKGLYQKAIVQSGGMTLVPMAEAENYQDDPTPGHPLSSRELLNLLLIRDGRATDRTGAKQIQQQMTNPEIAEYLRGQSAQAIIAGQEREPEPATNTEDQSAPFILGNGAPQRTPYIFGDGFVLPSGVQLDWLFADAGRYNPTPVILGSNRNETKLFMAFAPGYTKRLGPIPYTVADSERYARDTQYGSDLWKANAVDELATRLTRTQGDSVYAYRFDWDELRSIASLDFAELLGAAHAFELPFVFGNFGLVDKTRLSANPITRNALSNSMMSYWAEFAYNGSPSRGQQGNQVPWTPWSNNADANRVMLLDTNQSGGVRMSPLTVTNASIASTLAQDTRFTNVERCALAQSIWKDAPGDQVHLASAGCSTQ